MIGKRMEKNILLMMNLFNNEIKYLILSSHIFCVFKVSQDTVSWVPSAPPPSVCVKTACLLSFLLKFFSKKLVDRTWGGHHSSGQKKGQFYKKKIFTLCCLRWNINKSKFGKLTRSITASVRYSVNQYCIHVWCDIRTSCKNL